MEQPSNSDQETEDKELAQMSKPALIREVRRLRKENKILQEKVAQLEEKLEKITDKLEEENAPHFKPNKHQPEDSSNPSRKKGHQGESRETPSSEGVDEERTLDLKECPGCGNSFQDQQPQETRTR